MTDMTFGSGFVYGLGIVSGLVLAGLAFLIYLALRDGTDTTDPDVEAVTARVKALTTKVTSGKNKVQDATASASGIEPGDN